MQTATDWVRGLVYPYALPTAERLAHRWALELGLVLGEEWDDEKALELVCESAAELAYWWVVGLVFWSALALILE